MREHLKIAHENFWKNFDKILLAWMFMTVAGMCVWITLKDSMSEGALDWARSTANLILGGLLGLITGKYIADHGGTKPPPEQPPPPANGS